MGVATEVSALASSASVAAISNEYDGLFVFWHFRKFDRPRIARLEAVLYTKPGGVLEPFEVDSETRVLFDDVGQVRHFKLSWQLTGREDQLPPDLVKLAGGMRLSLLVRDLALHFPTHECEGWLRVPDGDLTEVEADWAILREADRYGGIDAIA